MEACLPWMEDAWAWIGGAAAPTDRTVAEWLALARQEPALRFERPAIGTVYGVLLNHVDALAALGDASQQPPYKAPPRAPVLYIKPRNTHSAHGVAIVVPAGVGELEMGATLGMVIGRTACRVSEAQALSYVAGYTVCNDVSVPHASYYRPSMRFKCRDGFLPIGPWIVAARHAPSPDALRLRVDIDGRTVLQVEAPELVRSAARLIADVTEFMTLDCGDVLMVGVPDGAPRARAGQRVDIHIDGVGTLSNPLVAEDAA
jgi:5-oxopent-3-ene-1,2,5-tricarboxylate decarboxylase / 2-hydroxyhepta-2,4-diene-1,7-dioate isomerase